MSTSLTRWIALPRSIAPPGLIALLFLFDPALSFASSPGLSHHGRLLDASDQPVNGVLNVTFTLYDAPTAGNALWTESWSVTFVNGYYSVLLGGPDGDPPNPIDPAWLDRQLYLGIHIADGPELQPRQTLGASVYALRAAVSDSVLGGTLSDVTITGATIDANSLNIRGAPLFDENGQWAAEPGLVPFVTESAVVLRAGDQEIDGALTADRFISTALSGSPLEVASDELVLNLNAEYVGGRHADELVDVHTFAESGFLNLALNGSFEKEGDGGQPTSWNAPNGGAAVGAGGRYGANVLRLSDSGDGTASVRQVLLGAEISTRTGSRFTASVHVRHVDGTAPAMLCLVDGPSEAQRSCATQATGTGWSLLSVTHTVSDMPLSLEVRLSIDPSGATASWDFDGVVVAEGPLVRAFAPHVSELVGSGAVGGDSLADGAVTTLKLADGSVTRDKLAVDAVDDSRLADGAVTSTKLAVGAVDSLAIGSGAVLSEAIAARAVTTSALDDAAVTTDKLGDGVVSSDKLAFGAVSSDAIEAGAVTTDALASGAVTADKLAEGAVTGASLEDGSVTREKIAHGAVDADRLAAGAVQADHIASTAVGSAAIADGAVTTTKLFEGAVTRAKLADQAVGPDQLADGAVGEAKLGSGAVTSSRIADGAIGEDQLADGAVSSLKLRQFAVTETRIAAAAVSSGKLQDSAVTEAKIAAGAVTSGKIEAGAVNESAIDDGAVTSTKLGFQAVTTTAIDDGAVTEAKLGPDSVTVGKLRDGAVIEAKLAGLAVTEGKIAASAVTADKLAIRAVETEKLDDLAVTTAKLGSKAVTVDKLGDLAVTTDKLANDAVTTAKIGDAQVTTNKLGDLQVTGAKIADGTISGGKLANLAVGNDQLADAAVTNDKILANSIEGDRLANLTITGGKIADATIPATKLIDGAGSDLDADRLDGLHAASFLRSDVATTAASSLTVKGELTVDNDATVNGKTTANSFDGAFLPRRQDWNTQGVGFDGAAIYNDGSPSYQALMIVGNHSATGVSTDRRVRIYDDLLVHRTIHAGGNIHATGNGTVGGNASVGGNLTVTGNLGIGIAPGAAKLDVNGLVRNRNAGAIVRTGAFTSAAGYSNGTYYYGASYSASGSAGYSNLINQGGAFNTSSGIFTAPVSGFYLVTFVLRSVQNVQNGRILVTASLDGGTPSEIFDIANVQPCATCADYSWSSLIYMNAGQTHRILRHSASYQWSEMVLGYHLLG